MTNQELTNLLTEARNFLGGEEYIDNAYRPFDQSVRIRHWGQGATFPAPEFTEFYEDLALWEVAHGHDARTKCYAEFGCQAIEGYAHSIIHRLLMVLEPAQ
jgi:hypothetical protein